MTLLDRLDVAFASRADPSKAADMAAYMRHQFPFLGIQSRERAAALREALAGGPGDVVAFATDCWERPEREYQYAAVAVLRRHAPRADESLLATAERLLTTKAWWDTVDELAIHVVGPLVARHGLQADMWRWVEGRDRWLARAAILHQNNYRERTDADLLFEFCRRRAADDEFFLRKAIGWALRQYARIDPDAVLRFVTDNEQALSGLSTREALRHVDR